MIGLHIQINGQNKETKMGMIELFMIGAGLSMDAFAAAVCKGLCMKKFRSKNAVTIALFFGGFQALMPLLGWFLGIQFEEYITSIDHWIAFVLLGFIGLNMVREGLSKDEAGEEKACPIDGRDNELSLQELFVMSIATSIDALAVGVTFAFLRVNIVPAITIIGCTTFILSFCGVFVGNYFGAKYKKKAELAGGIILIMIGIKILMEHLGIL